MITVHFFLVWYKCHCPEISEASCLHSEKKIFHLVGLLCPHKAKGLMKALVKEIALELGEGNWIAYVKEFGYESFSSSHLGLPRLAIRAIKVIGVLMSYKAYMWLKISNLSLSHNSISTDMSVFHKHKYLLVGRLHYWAHSSEHVWWKNSCFTGLL